MKWKEKIIKQVVGAIKGDKNFDVILDKLTSGEQTIGVHVAVFSEPYLTLLLEGTKTVESRFSVNRLPPYRKVFPKDIILVKRPGGAIIGLFTAGETKYFANLNQKKLQDIEGEFSQRVCSHIDPAFWEVRNNTNFASLISVDQVRIIDPFLIEKSDRTAWSIVQNKILSLFDSPV